MTKKLEIKMQWKEHEEVTNKEILIFNIILDLLNYINSILQGFWIKLPVINDLQYNFLSSNYKYDKKGNFFNNESLTSFFSIFFPYFSVVLNPRKKKNSK